MGNLGTVKAVPDITCKHCGRVYSVRWEKMGIKERGLKNCACRKILYEWNSASDPEFTIVKNTTAS